MRSCAFRRIISHLNSLHPSTSTAPGLLLHSFVLLNTSPRADWSAPSHGKQQAKQTPSCTLATACDMICTAHYILWCCTAGSPRALHSTCSGVALQVYQVHCTLHALVFFCRCAKSTARYTLWCRTAGVPSALHITCSGVLLQVYQELIGLLHYMASSRCTHPPVAPLPEPPRSPTPWQSMLPDARR